MPLKKKGRFLTKREKATALREAPKKVEVEARNEKSKTPLQNMSLNQKRQDPTTGSLLDLDGVINSHLSNSQTNEKSVPGSLTVPRGLPYCLEGLTFVVTGQFAVLSREDALELIKSHGGQIRSSVTKKLSFLVVGFEPGQSKLSIAKRLKKKCISETELYALINAKSKVGRPMSSTTNSFTSSPKQIRKETLTKSKEREESGKDSTSTENMELVHCIEDPLWCEKYRPKLISQLCFPSTAIRLKGWVEAMSSRTHSSASRSALLSGPPGTGKTTVAHVVANELNHDLIELNASDTRSASTLWDQLSDVVCNHGITKKKKIMILLDEIDGCDRGGVSALIKLIKKSKVPIICTCNDRWHPKLRSLMNYVEDMRISRTPANHIASYMTKILKKEGIEIPYVALQDVITLAGNDFRAVFNNIQSWTRTNKSFDYHTTKYMAKSGQKDDEQNLFGAVESFFSPIKKKGIYEYMRLFYAHDLLPLFVQENYLQYNPRGIQSAADSIARGDVFNRKMVLEQQWKLSVSHFFFSSMLPTFCTRGQYTPFTAKNTAPNFIRTQFIRFPAWLGRNSSQRRILSIIEAIVAGGTLPQSSCTVSTEYLPVLRETLTRPLINIEKDKASAVREVLDRLHYYRLTREDWEAIIEITSLGNRVSAPLIPSSVKGLLTREYKKTNRFLPYTKTLSFSPIETEVLDFNQEVGERPKNNATTSIEKGSLKRETKQITQEKKKIRRKMEEGKLE